MKGLAELESALTGSILPVPRLRADPAMNLPIGSGQGGVSAGRRPGPDKRNFDSSRRNGAVWMKSENGKARNEELGDFTTTWRVLPISLLAIVIGVLCAYVALALLRLIGLFTNLFYFGRWSTAMLSPVGNQLGVFSVLVPIGGALIIGVMARYGRNGFVDTGFRRPSKRS